ncbi:MAG: DUF3592 domain-containing protein [Bacteroidota bacterium]
MANKIKFYHLWSLKNIVSTVVACTLIIIFLVLYYFYPQLSHYYKVSKFDAQTTGVVIDINEQSIINQTKMGNKVQVYHLEVKYKYSVSGQVYVQIDKVKGTGLNNKRLKEVWNSNKSINVLYRTENPAQSMVELKR